MTTMQNRSLNKTDTTDSARTGMAGTGVLLRFMLRQDRVRLSLWVLGIGLMSFYVANAVQALVTDEAELAQMAGLFADPVGRLMTGPAYGMESPTFERFYAAGYVLFIYILTALMSIFTVVRHTRAEEASGRAELLRADVLGRHATLTAALLLVLLANAAAAMLVLLGALSGGFAQEGSLLVAGSGAAIGLLFAAVAALAAQLTETSRAASGLTGALLGLAYLIRMVGDMAAVQGTALSWFSPLGWSQQTAPYVEDRWWPLLLCLALAAAAVLGAFGLSTRRDLGAGLLPSRLGRAQARPRLTTPLGVATHTLRGGLRGWGAAVILCGALFGSYAQSMVDTAASLPEEFRSFFAGETVLLGYLAYMAMFLALFVAAAGVGGIQQLRGEEKHGRAELLLSAPLSRTRWLGAHLTVLLGGLGIMLSFTGLATAAAAVAVLQDDPAAYFNDILWASLHQGPAVLAVVGLTLAAYGWVPRFAGLLGWLLLGYAAVMTNFGPLLDLPTVFSELNVFGHLAQYPVEAVRWSPVLWLSGIGTAGILLGFTGWRRRVINSG
ncbi:ABC-2 type transport system permease protein [Nesterenkonia aurantiaca]|uniref:ABC-2 type transport system permease protein n=2 Tax=Nesterenkonia aurantiaca TaxID=1436010 RepID=A0A4R7G5P4_9MICC|nr:ABC-2 type transport system permease protein [Nesterenkonia aurantiaca]